MLGATAVKARYDLSNKLPGQALHCWCWRDRQALLTKMSQFMFFPLRLYLILSMLHGDIL